MIKKLASYIREYKTAAFLTSFFVALEVVMEILIPQCMAKIIDVGLPSGNGGYVVKMGILMVLMACLSLFFGVSSGRNAAKSGSGLCKKSQTGAFLQSTGIVFCQY